jgi:hypothetical protein
VQCGIRERLLEDPVGGLVSRRCERAGRAVDLDGDREPGGAVALGKGVERGETGRRLHPVGGTVFAQRPDELVDFADRVACDRLDRLERFTRAPRVVLLQKPSGAGLDEDDVDRMACGVVQIAGDAGALLGGRQAALAFGLALGPPRAFHNLREPLSPQSRPVAGEPGGQPDGRAEQQLGREAIADHVRPDQDDEAAGKDDRPGAWVRLVTVLGCRVEGDRKADRWTEAVSEAVEGRGRRGHKSKDGWRRDPPPG